MRARIRLRVCPEPGCPKVGAASCPEHGKDMVPIVYVKQDVRDQLHATMNKVAREFRA